MRKVASYAEKRGDYVVLEDMVAGNGDKRPKQRAGFPRHLPLKQSDFHTVLSVRAKNRAHNNILECEAYLLWLKWLLRNTRFHNCRATCLVDSKVVIGGVMKGRSSSRPLLRVLRRVAAMQLAGNILARLVYVPTECNPSDPPSRGVRTRGGQREQRNTVKHSKWNAKKSKYHERLARSISRSPYAAELSQLVDGDPTFWDFRARR